MGATFQCKLDRAPYKPCRSPLTTKQLSVGRHVLKVRAVLAAATDPTPLTLPLTILAAK
jgi:hypothetical protein